MLEENNETLKLEIMKTLKLTMEENNEILVKKIDTKWIQCLKNFQHISCDPLLKSYKVYNQSM